SAPSTAFFDSTSTPHYIHSIPTRRSSDLAWHLPGANPHGDKTSEQTGDQTTDKAGTDGHSDGTASKARRDTRASGKRVGNVAGQGRDNKAHGSLAGGKEYGTDIQQESGAFEG